MGYNPKTSVQILCKGNRIPGVLRTAYESHLGHPRGYRKADKK